MTERKHQLPTPREFVKWSNDAAKFHDLHGVSIVALRPARSTLHSQMVNLTDEPMVVPGRKVRPKSHIRAFLWQNRDLRAAVRPGATLWTCYDEEANTSFIGLGAFVTKRAAMKMAMRSFSPVVMEAAP